ncbi:hypothetical protein D3C78_1476230 [compost metagenome]
MQATAADQRQRYRLLLVGNDNTVVQAEVFGTKTAGEGITVNHETYNIVFKTMTKDLRQLVAAVAQGALILEAFVGVHELSLSKAEAIHLDPIVL